MWRRPRVSEPEAYAPQMQSLNRHTAAEARFGTRGPGRGLGLRAGARGQGGGRDGARSLLVTSTGNVAVDGSAGWGYEGEDSWKGMEGTHGRPGGTPGQEPSARE